MQLYIPHAFGTFSFVVCSSALGVVGWLLPLGAYIAWINASRFRMVIEELNQLLGTKDIDWAWIEIEFCCIIYGFNIHDSMEFVFYDATFLLYLDGD